MRERDLLDFPRQQTPWRIRDCLAIILLVALSSLALTMLGDWLLSRLGVDSNSREAMLVVAAGYLQSLFFLGLVFFWVLVKYRSPLAALGLKIRSLKEVFSYGILAGLAILLVVVFLMALVISLGHRTPPPQPLTEMLIANSRNREFLLFSFILVGVLAPLSEEIYFRGFVYPALRCRLGMLSALLISSAFFGALHFDLYRFLPLTAGGAALALICERTGSLVPPIFAHSTWNITMLLLLLAGRPF